MRLLLVATGDTISYRLDPARPGIATAAELLAAALPDGLPGVRIVLEDQLREPSWDVSGPTLLALARRVRAALGEEGFDAVVVTHGLDTVAEAAFLTDLMLGAATPRGAVVFTGAVRPFDDPAADGPANLAAALVAATAPRLRGAGVLVGAGTELHAARWVALRDATGDRAPLSSWPRSPVVRVSAGQVEPLAAPPHRPPGPPGEPEWDVALVGTYPGMEPVVLSALADANVRGVVLAGTGAGNVPTGLLAAVSDLIEWGVPVVVASRCHTGTGEIDASRPDQGIAYRLGAVSARGLAPEQARVALMVALGAGGVSAVRSWFAAL